MMAWDKTAGLRDTEYFMRQRRLEILPRASAGNLFHSQGCSQAVPTAGLQTRQTSQNPTFQFFQNTE